MEFLSNPVTLRLLTGLIVFVTMLLLYFSIDIYLVLARKEFGRVNFYLVYFTRHDHAGSNTTKKDALHLRMVGTKLSLVRDIFKNRYLFWLTMYAVHKARVEKPVLELGSRAEAVLIPFKNWFASNRGATGEIKRAAGLPFRETRYQLALVYDRSENKRHYIIKVLLIRQQDLEDFQQYVDKPPKTEQNLGLIKKVAEAYHQKHGSFIHVQLVAA